MNSLFLTPQRKLAKESWRLLLRQKTDKELFMEKQKKILQEIREW